MARRLKCCSPINTSFVADIRCPCFVRELSPKGLHTVIYARRGTSYVSLDAIAALGKFIPLYIQLRNPMYLSTIMGVSTLNSVYCSNCRPVPKRP